MYKAVNDERLAQVQLDHTRSSSTKAPSPKTRSRSRKNAEDDAKASLVASEDQLRVLGIDKITRLPPSRIPTPTSGIVIIAQNVTNAAAAAGVTFAGSPRAAFTIADLSHVWISICDVLRERSLDRASGRRRTSAPAAYPDRVLGGVISDIGAVLDPQLRTAKVRIQVDDTVNTPDARWNVRHRDHPRRNEADLL